MFTIIIVIIVKSYRSNWAKNKTKRDRRMEREREREWTSNIEHTATFPYGSKTAEKQRRKRRGRKKKQILTSINKNLHTARSLCVVSLLTYAHIFFWGVDSSLCQNIRTPAHTYPNAYDWVPLPNHTKLHNEVNESIHTNTLQCQVGERAPPMMMIQILRLTKNGEKERTRERAKMYTYIRKIIKTCVRLTKQITSFWCKRIDF